MGFYKNDATAANNTSVNGIAIQGSSSPANIDNALRELTAQGKQFALDIGGAITAGGTADALTITLNDGALSSGDSYFDGLTVRAKAASDNLTTLPTLNVASIGAEPIKKASASDGAEAALAVGDIQAGGVYDFLWRSTWDSGGGAWQLINLNEPSLSILEGNDPVLRDSDLGKQTVFIPAASMLAATTNGPASADIEATTNAQNYTVLDFDASTDEYAHFQIAMPKSWDEGTVTFQVFWSTTATDTDGVAWGLQGVAVSDGDTIDASWGTAVVVTDDAQSAAGDVLVTAESSAVTIGGTPAAGDMSFFRLFRDVSDANDDMTEDARLIGIKLIYTIDALKDD